MKKIISTVLLLSFIVNHSFSQENNVQNLRLHDNKRLHFGFTVGINTSDFYIRNSDTFFDTSIIRTVYSIENKQQPGFHLGPLSNLRLAEYLDFRFLINLTFIQRDLEYVLKETNSLDETYFITHTMQLSSTFIEFPMLFKYKSDRINNYRFYLIGGIKPVLDLASKKKIPAELMPMISLAQPDVYGEIGLGLDLYFPYFKFSPELKMGIGINNMAVDDGTEYSRAMKYLKSKVFMLSFHFSG